MEAGDVAGFVVLFFLLVASCAAVAYLLYDRHVYKKDLKASEKELKAAKKSLAEYRTEAVSKLPARVGLAYQTTDPVMKRLFDAVQKLVSVYQGLGCEQVMSNLREIAEEVEASFKKNEVPCKDMREALNEFKNDPDVKDAVPREAMRHIDDIIDIVMEAVCDGSGYVDGKLFAKFLTGLSTSLCDKRLF
jgi:hypothetical protein